MLEGGKITYQQMILLFFVSRVITWIAFLPVIQAPPANQDVWLDCLTAFPIHLIIALPIYLLSKKFPKQGLYEYSQAIMGKAGQWVIATLYIGFFIHASAFALGIFSEFFTTVIMSETPSLFFVITLVLVAAYAVQYGIEVLGRLSEFFAPIIMIALIGVTFLLIKDMDLRELTPILEAGIYPAFLNGFTPVSETLEIIGLAIIAPYLNDFQKIKKVYLITPLLLQFFLFLLTTLVISLLGDEVAKSYPYPVYSVIRLVHVGDFLERIESIHVAAWILGTFIKIALYYYLVVLGLGQLLHLQTYKPLILPIGTILIPLSSVLVPSVVEMKEFLSFKIYPWYSMPFIFFLPSLMLLIAIIRKKGERQR